MGVIIANCGETGKIGYQTENNRTQVRFPLKDIMDEFPGGTATLVVQRSGDEAAAPAAETQMDGTDLIWTVNAWECAVPGFVYAQVIYAVTAGEVVAKTKIYRFSVKESLLNDAVEPDDWEDWVGELAQAAAGVNDAIGAAQESLNEKVAAAEMAKDAAVAAVESYDAMTATASGLPAGSAPTAEIDHTGENPVLQLGIPAGADGAPGQNGAPGADGFSPVATVTKSGKVATITVTDKSGTTSAQVSDGADGTDVIDDTAGLGDTDKTFSANKLTQDHSALLNALNQSNSATNSDIGKAHSPKTVDENGHVTEWQYIPVGGGGGGGIDLGIIGATVGQIAKITAVDANGTPTAWEPAEVYPKKMFEYEWTGHWEEIDIVALDYSTGVITIGNYSNAVFTDSYSTTAKVFVCPLIEGVKTQWKYGYMPPELYTIQVNGDWKAVLVGDHQIKIFKNSTTSINALTQPSIVDLTKMKLVATNSRNVDNTKTVTGLLPNHRYRFTLFTPQSGRQNIVVLRQDNSIYRYSEGTGYRAYSANVNSAVLPATPNATDFLWGGDIGQDIYANGTPNTIRAAFPQGVDCELYRMSNGTWFCTGVYVYTAFMKNDITQINEGDVPTVLSKHFGLYLNGAPGGIQFNASAWQPAFPGSKCSVYDLGEFYHES